MRQELSARSMRSRLRTGAGLAALASLMLAGMANAQTTPTAAPADDGLGENGVYVEADGAQRDGDVITATGDAESRALVRARNYSLRAREVTYDLQSGVATASGQAELIAPSGDVAYASRLITDPDLQVGVAVDFATRLENGASLMAATAVRRSETSNELNYALFTPCPICDAKGEPKTPSISIQAERVVQDAELRAILYRNALFKIGGVPVLYLPFFSHPDPSVERASGFLVPIVNYDEGRGVSLETPYLHVVSPSEDWLISPQFNTKVAPLLNLQWRRRFNDGIVEARGGYTYAENFGDFDADNDGVADIPLEDEHRSYILSWGRFDPDGPWRWGFTGERTSDKTLFDRYDVVDPYQDNGLYYGDQRRLISQLYAERQTERSYLSIAAFSIQSLRVAQTNEDALGLNVFEDDDTLPLVAPLIDARWEPEGPIFGGRLRLRGSAVSLFRDAYVGSPVLRPELIPDSILDAGGVDSRRISGQAEWRRTFITPQGIRLEPFADGRVDTYSIGDLPPALGLDDDAVTRSRFTAGMDVSYPLIRPMGGGRSLVLEPMGQLSISNDPDLDPRIPNEDSQILELDETSLFQTDPFPGYDLVEGGSRFTAGARATYRWGEGRTASLFVGRSLRSDRELGFRIPIPDDPDRLYDPTGLARKTSDWVVQAEFEPSDRVRGWGHATVDSSGDIRRAEAAVDGRWGRRNMASLNYIVDRTNPLDGPLNRNYEFVQLAAQQFVYGNWGVATAGIADLQRDQITRSEIGLVYDDDCLRVELGFRRDNTRVRPTGPSEGVYVRLNLATFGGSGYGRSDMR